MTKPVAALISCVSKKQKKPCRAIELYTSDLYLKSRKFAQQYGLPIYILSAEYGLINSDRVIAPYDLTLNKMTKSNLDKWAVGVAELIITTFGNDTLLVLAGENYLSFSKYTKNRIINPLQGLPIGQRLQWLKQNTK